MNTDLRYKLSEKSTFLYLAFPLMAAVNTSVLRFSLIQLGDVHLHRKEMKRLDSAKTYFGSFCKRKIIPTHSSQPAARGFAASSLVRLHSQPTSQDGVPTVSPVQ